jgi:hypothetical protein
VFTAQITSTDDDQRVSLGGCSGARPASAKVITKPRAGQSEQAAFMIGSLLGVPVVPGFADADNNWHSVFVPGMQTVRDRFEARRGWVTDKDAFRAWVQETDNVRAMARLRAFDEVISNGDRHHRNLGVACDALVVFDHDLIFDDFCMWGVHDDVHSIIPREMLVEERARARDLLSPSIINALPLQQGWREAIRSTIKGW